MLFGDHLTLHPVVVLLSLAFWGVLWGKEVFSS
jgi:predicted PurR-regulated permease PerM